MKTIVIASRKGGAGKTTNARHLAVAYVLEGKKVLLVDTDTQGTLTDWLDRRKTQAKLDDMDIVTVDYSRIAEVPSAAAEAGYDVLLIDTPPDSNEAIQNTVKLADLVLIPCKASPDDIGSVAKTHALVKDLNVPYAFIINEAKPNTTLLTLALETMSQLGPVAPTQYSHVSIPLATLTGMTVLDNGSKEAAHAKRLHAYVQNLLGV